MSRLMLSLVLIAAACAARAQTFSDSFEGVIAPQFPQVNGQFVLPPAPQNPRLSWLLGELAVGQTTTVDEVNEHFDASWLAVNDVAATIDLINSIRTSYPNARITDLISHTPIRLTALIDTPGSGFPSGFLQFGTRWTAPSKIVQLGVNSFGGNVSFPIDQGLTLAQAADKMLTLSTEGAMVVARAHPGGTCSSVIGRNADEQRAIGSVFKTWLVGGVAMGIRDGTLSPAESLAMTSSIIAPSGIINSEPVGTTFPIADLATLMQGNSDNTATDMLLARVGRAPIETLVVEWGMPAPPAANPLLPFMGISQTFHLFRTFPLATAQNWLALTEAEQVDFLETQIIPRANNHGNLLHASLLTRVSWRASPLEICRAMGGLRFSTPGGSDSLRLVDRAMGAQAALPNVRAEWDRVWYKGGSLASGAGTHVLVHTWLLEDAGRDPYVVVLVANSDGGGINAVNIQSVAGRILQLTAALP